ncbi:hypothetical protein MUK42_15893 [Musa troglodytarum]|uniref:Small VCP/p97-interacting protein n=1 Tax=Musa troglodytarum TaxID=320322 RepID=A0A9E7GXP6_9LILI|nr:hypothetical protein MUK42_15893 [Musa troglodytarum]
MRLCSCFGPSKAERREADRFEAEEARARAAEAAQKRQEQFEKSAAGRAARAQIAATKKSSEPSKGEPVLKVTCIPLVTNYLFLFDQQGTKCFFLLLILSFLD